MAFGERLKATRTTLGLTQEELAEMVGTTKQAISRYENGGREPNLRTAKILADRLGVSLDDLAEARRH